MMTLLCRCGNCSVRATTTFEALYVALAIHCMCHKISKLVTVLEFYTYNTKTYTAFLSKVFSLVLLVTIEQTSYRINASSSLLLSMVYFVPTEFSKSCTNLCPLVQRPTY